MPGGVIGEIVANFVEGEIEFVLGGGGFGRSGDDESPVVPPMEVPLVVFQKLGRGKQDFIISRANVLIK